MRLNIFSEYATKFIVASPLSKSENALQLRVDQAQRQHIFECNLKSKKVETATMVASNSALKSGGRSNKPQPPGLTRRPVSPNTWPHQKPHTLSSSARDRGGNGAGGGGAQSVRLHEQHERDSLLMAAAAGVGLGPAVSPYEVKPLQFADYSVGLAFKHLPILLIITGPLSLLLISIGSLWLVWVRIW